MPSKPALKEDARLITVRVPESLLGRLERAKMRDGYLSTADAIRRALVLYVEAHERNLSA